ncbi:MAG: fumarate reductase subunit D [Alphaproteobacteria bacterium]|nr:fumarate reductase subunit D [Alphaproteobacteria bacterium]
MKRSHKPIIWSLFAAGGTFTAFMIPVMILITGLGVPLGLLPAQTLDYESVLAFVQHPLTRIALFGTIFLTVWHAAHRLRITAHDFGIRADRVVATIFYGLAAITTLVALVVLALI